MHFLRNLVIGLVVSMVAFYSITNLPPHVPPRWTYRDCLTYRYYNFYSQFGIDLSKDQGDQYGEFIQQGILYGMAESVYNHCVKQGCQGDGWSSEMIKWHNTPPPKYVKGP